MKSLNDPLNDLKDLKDLKDLTYAINHALNHVIGGTEGLCELACALMYKSGANIYAGYLENGEYHYWSYQDHVIYDPTRDQFPGNHPLVYTTDHIAGVRIQTDEAWYADVIARSNILLDEICEKSVDDIWLYLENSQTPLSTIYTDIYEPRQ